MPLPYEALQMAYQKIAPYPDGVILADTYTLNMNMSADAVIKFLVNFSMKKHQSLAKKYMGSFDKSEWFSIVTIASIIQKEAASIDEMGLVASVIYNRLQKRMRLQMDGALNYGIYAHSKVTKQRIRQDRSHFNTYKYRGIPKYPVSIVSQEAIHSAIHPKKSDFFYFVKDKNRNGHIFAKTYEEHKKNIHFN